MIQKKIEKSLNTQIELEASSSQLYLSMASWAEVQGFNGVSQFLYKHADEERIHMLKLFHYINERGGHGLVPALKQPPYKFSSVKEIFEEVYRHEKKVSSEINSLVDICLSEKDYTTHNFLQWYITEQIEEENLAKNILDKIKLLGDDKGGLYMLDRDLETMATAIGGTAPSA